MTPERIVQHQMDDGSFVGVFASTKRENTEYVFVMEGAGGLETVINFDDVDVGQNTVEFYRRVNHTTRVKTGQIENGAFGPVSEWLTHVGEGGPPTRHTE